MKEFMRKKLVEFYKGQTKELKNLVSINVDK